MIVTVTFKNGGSAIHKNCVPVVEDDGIIGILTPSSIYVRTYAPEEWDTITVTKDES